MRELSYPEALAHLMGRLGQEVAVSLGTPIPGGTWHAATITGTLMAGWDAEERRTTAWKT